MYRERSNTRRPKFDAERDTVSVEYSHLAEGESAAGQQCPACQGGGSGERTLSVSRKDGLLLWYCHRDSCGFRGAEAGARIIRKISDHTGSEEPRGLVGRTIARTALSLDEKSSEYIKQRYGITKQHIGRWNLGWDSESGRLSMPVFSATGEVRGVSLRALSSLQKPKTLTHTEKDAIAWYSNPRHRGLVIVEDQFSAIRAADYTSSVALLGTHLNEERVAEIVRAKKAPVYLALDNDAIATAVKHVIKYKSMLPMQIIKLDKDIKDLDNDEARELFSQIM